MKESIKIFPEYGRVGNDELPIDKNKINVTRDSYDGYPGKGCGGESCRDCPLSPHSCRY